MKMKHVGWVVQFSGYKSNYFKEKGTYRATLFNTTMRCLKKNALATFYDGRGVPPWKMRDRGVVKAVKVYVEARDE